MDMGENMTSLGTVNKKTSRDLLLEAKRLLLTLQESSCIGTISQ